MMLDLCLTLSAYVDVACLTNLRITRFAFVIFFLLDSYHADAFSNQIVVCAVEYFLPRFHPSKYQTPTTSGYALLTTVMQIKVIMIRLILA